MENKLTIDDLGAIIKDGFDETGEEIKGVKNEIKALRRDMDEIKMKFAYTARQIDVEEMKKRVVAIERKVGIKYKF